MRDEGDGGRSWVTAATILILPKEEDAQIYSIWGGEKMEGEPVRVGECAERLGQVVERTGSVRG